MKLKTTIGAGASNKHNAKNNRHSNQIFTMGPGKKLSGQLGLELGAPVAEEIGESGRVHRAAADYVLWRAFSRVKRHFSGFSQFGRCLGSYQGLLSLFNQMGFAGQQ